MINKLEYKKIEQLLISNISNTKENLRIAVAWFTNPNIFELILKLLEKKINVELILSNDKINFTNPKINFDEFIKKNGSLSVNVEPNLMHNKFCIIDNRFLISGSYNWTLKAEKVNFENVVLTDNLNLINDFKDYFEFLKVNTIEINKVNLIQVSNYSLENEIVTEFELIEKTKKTEYEISKETITNNEYTTELLELIDDAELLYLNSKHQDCIDFCDKILKKHKNISELYYKKASSYWRLDKTKELIENAKKAIEIDNEFYDAYNMLGMGYAKIGKEQLSIQNFDNCIRNQPNEYVYYRNRAISYFDLKNITSLTSSIRNNYAIKEKADLEKILEIISKKDDTELDYSTLYTKSFANFYLNKIKNAKNDIENAIENYNNEKNLFLKDKNILKDMKSLQKEINNYKK